MLTHRAWALATLAVLVVLAGRDVWRNKVDAMPSGWSTAAAIGAAALVSVTAWHGGELVYRHGIGVMALPMAEEGRHHDHGGEAAPDAHAHTDGHDHGDHDH